MIGALGVGSVLADRYRLIRLVGSDDTSDVYEAEDEQLQRRVAVKVMNEAGLLAAPERVDSARVYDGGEHDGAAFVVLEAPVPSTTVAAPDGTMGTDGDAATRTMPVADSTSVMPAALAPHEDPPLPVRPRRWALAAVLVGLVLLIAALAAGSGGGLDLETPSTTAPNGTVVTSSTPTTAAPTTTQAPEGKRKGKGHRGDD